MNSFSPKVLIVTFCLAWKREIYKGKLAPSDVHTNLMPS